MTAAAQRLPFPHREEYGDYTSYDAARWQWLAARLWHNEDCLDEVKQDVKVLKDRVAREELEEAMATGAMDVKKRQMAFFTGLINGIESWVGKAALIGIGGGAVAFLTKVVGL